MRKHCGVGRGNTSRDRQEHESGAMMSNPYQGSVVRRADGCIAQGGGPPHGQPMKRRLRASSADLISVTGHSRGLHQTPIEGQCFRGAMFHGKQWPRKGHALETLLCPPPGPVNASGLCLQTLPVSVGLGGGAATGPLVTSHQGGERERRSNQRHRAPGSMSKCPRTVNAV